MPVLEPLLRIHAALGAVQFVELFQFRVALPHELRRPVLRARERLRLRREQAGDLHVAGVHAEQRAVLAHAPALHPGAHHHRREHAREPVVDGREHERLRPAAARAGHAEALRVHVRQTGEEVQRADAVPRLKAHLALQAQFGVGVLEPFAVRDRGAVRVPDHVVLEHDEPELRECGRERLHEVPAAVDVRFAAGLHAGLAGLLAVVVEPPAGPVAVREQHAGALHGLAFLGSGRPIQVAADVVARRAGEVHLLDGVLALVDLAVNDRVQRRLLRQRPQARRDEHLLAELLPPRLPNLFRLRHDEREVVVERLGRAEPRVGRLLTVGEHLRRIGLIGEREAERGA